jgi:hypothetical protein
MKQYEAMIADLEKKGIKIKTSKYDDHAMGSWYIVTNTMPPYRIVHDGRDKTVVLEVLENEWNPLIADKTQSGKHVISRLMDELLKS